MTHFREATGKYYYVKRKVPGFGRVQRSLRTADERHARKLESMLDALIARGRADLFGAWLSGDVDLTTLLDAYETGQLGKLALKLESIDVPLRDAVTQFLEARAGTIRKSTFGRYRASLDHVLRLMPSTVQQALITANVDTFRSQRVQEGAKHETVNNDLVALSAFATFAIDNGWLQQRPKFKRFKRVHRIRYLDSGEIAVYLGALRPAFKPLMKTLIGTGMRLGEAEQLTPGDLRTEPDGMARAQVHKAKTAKGVRTLFVPAWVASLLQHETETRRLRPADRIFTIPRRTVQKEHTRACQLVGISRYVIHDHRHTAAVHLSLNGMPLHLLQQQLGHATLEQTMEYARFNPEYADVSSYFAKVEERLRKAIDV